MTANLRLVPDEGTRPLLFARPVYYSAGSALTELEPDSLRAHHDRVGPRPDDGQALALVERAGLTGLGGGHFPVAHKWRAVLADAETSGRAPIAVANGAEGEPLSRKDTALLELRPHLVLDGLLCAAGAVGADEAIIWLHDGDHPARSALARALAERDAGAAEPAIRIAVGPDRYLTGETTAVARGIGGGPALPTFQPTPGVPRDADGRPVLVQNVETLARVALAARGVPDVAATVLVSVAVDDTVVVLELPVATSVADAVRTVLDDEIHAVLLGGYGGTWLSTDAAATTDLRRAGAGVLAPLRRGECGVARTAEIVERLAAAGARQCGPCLFGLDAIAGSVQALARARRRDRRTASRIEGLLPLVDGRGACRHPDGAVRMVTSALACFADDVVAHRRGSCLHDVGRPGDD